MRKFTKRGHDAIVAEIERLWNVERPFVLEEIFEAAVEPYVIMSDQRLTGRDIHSAIMEALDSCKSWHKSELSILEDLESYASGSRPVCLD